MSMSGIDVDAETLAVFNKMKIKGPKATQEPKKQLLVLEIHNEKQVKVNPEKCADICDNDSLRKFLRDHPNEPFYIIHDFSLGKSKKLIGIAWIPETCKVKPKMIYSSTFEGIKGNFEGVKWCGTITDVADCEDSDIAANF